MTRCVFWYGTPKGDLSGGFSFVQSNKVISYEEGCKQHCNKLPAKIEKSLETGKRLTANESQLVTGLEQISIDAKLDRADRCPWLFEFEEDYEDYLDAIDDVTSEEDNDEEMEQLDSGKKKKKKQKDNVEEMEQLEASVSVKKKKRKKKVIAEEMDQLEASVDNGKKKKKKKKNGEHEDKKKKRKRKSIDEEEAASKKAKKSKSLDEEIEEEVAQENAFMEIDAPSDDDADDVDFSHTASESEEELYEDANEEEKPAKNMKKTSKEDADEGDKFTKKSKKTSKDESKTKASTTKTKGKKKVKSPEDIEQELFEECERVFLPIMDQLKEVQDEADAEKLVKKIDRNVQTLTPSFIRTHQIGLVVKTVRSQFKDSSQMNLICKQVTSKMKTVFHEKLQSEPTEFEPKLKKTAKKKAKPEVQKEKRAKLSVADEKESTVSSQNGSKSPVPTMELAIPKKETNEAGIQEIKPEKKTRKPVKLKPPRKSFSLADMIDQKPTPAPVSSSSYEKEPGTETDIRVDVKEAQPQWTVDYQPTSPNSFESNPDRSFAMEFLMEAVSCLPKGKVDPPSVARAIEDALYTKYEGEHDIYMERIHDISAAIGGKKQMGSLAQKIIDGNYATPLDVLNVSRKLLFQSFEGFWIP